MATDVKTENKGGGMKRATDRDTWDRPVEFLLSCIGYAVGIGNLWRFPYLCMRNGGGAFLIPYFIFLFIGGIPLFFLELIIGQYSSLSPIAVWKLCPMFKGLGWSMAIITGIISVYYNVVISWCLYYIGHSFYKTLPWATCGNPWNTPGCLERLSKEELSNSSQFDTNTTDVMVAASAENTTNTLISNAKFVIIGNQTFVSRTPAEEFWAFNVHERSSGIEHLDGIRWELLVCLFVSWVVVFLCLSKGVKTSGKVALGHLNELQKAEKYPIRRSLQTGFTVVYVTATFPYLFLTILCIRGLLLPGAVDGIKYYLIPDFRRLAEFKVWIEAFLQIFYSLGPAWGGLITMASFNKFDHKLQKDAIVIPLVNCFTSFYGGFVIFSIIGYMARSAGLPVDEILTSGPGLAFIAYPEAIARMPLSPLWAIIFFIMLLTLGLDSQFAMCESLVSAVVDLFPGQMQGKKRTLVTLAVSILLFILGLPFITRGGIYLFTLTDWYIAMYSVTVIALLECIIIAWIYGWRRFYEDIEMMLGHKPNQIWRILWCFVTPIMMAGVIVFTMFQVTEATYGDYSYPRWAIAYGWCVGIVSLVPIPVVAVMEVRKQKGSFLERVKKSLKPAADWGPAHMQFEKVASENDEPTEEETKLNLREDV